MLDLNSALHYLLWQQSLSLKFLGKSPKAPLISAIKTPSNSESQNRKKSVSFSVHISKIGY